jgi:hypothetical protein
VVTATAQGREIYCASCRNILESSVLDFQVKTADLEIQQCSRSGLPGWKGPAPEAKCYTFSPGNPESEEGAKMKARASAHSSIKSAAVERLAIAFFDKNGIGAVDFPTDEEPLEKDVVTGSSPEQRIVPDTTLDEFGNEVNPTGYDQATSVLAGAEDDLGLDELGRKYFTGPCTKCGLTDHLGNNCPHII